MSLEKIKQVLKNLPEIEQGRAVVAIEGKVYTWQECRDIIEKDENSDLAKKVIERLEEIIK